MTDITFLKTGHDYDSYTDWFRLVELAGFPIIRLSDLDISMPGVFIGAPHNGEWEHIQNQVEAGRQRNAHIILWNIERPSGSAGSVGKYGARGRELQYMRQVDEVWVSDRQLAAETSLRYVTLGSHPEFGFAGNAPKKWDFCHLSAEVPRRVHVYKHFDRERIAPNSWPPERDAVLAASSFGMATHQDDHPFLEPLRMAIFAAWGLPTLVETVKDAFPYSPETAVFAHHHDMADRMKQMIASDYAPFREMGKRMREMMTVEYEFGKMVRIAVEQRVGDWR